MSRQRFFLVAATAVAVAGSCWMPASAKDLLNTKKPPPELGAVDASGTYQMSAEEQAYDCKKLLGTMQIRIMQVRNYDPSRQPSELAKQMQKAADPALAIMFGKTTRQGDTAKRYRDDRAMLEAYNRLAAAKGCKVYDLEAELKPGKSPADLPVARPAQAPPAAKPATPATK